MKKAKLVNDILVATSSNTENKPLIEFLKKKKLSFFVDQKTMRSQDFILLQKNKSKIIVRITGDCPLADPSIVDEFILDFKKIILIIYQTQILGHILMDLMLKYLVLSY